MSSPLEASFSSPDALGSELLRQGWKQGALLPVLSYTVVCDPSQPVTAASKTATNTLRSRGYEGMPSHAIAAAVRAKPTERLIVISQTCDIARSSELEPTVLAARAFYTNNEKQKEIARRSTRWFLLDDASGLVVDIREVVAIEKPLFRTIQPVPPPASAAIMRQFARWLGDRFARPPHPDLFEEKVLGPLYDVISSLLDASDPRLLFLKSRGVELRIVPPADSPPFPVKIFAMLPSDDPVGNALELGMIKTIAQVQEELFSKIDRSFIEGIPTITPVRLDRISAQQFLDLDPLRFN